ncbi:DUF1636 family protein [Granulosicoccus sp. 3-233]|uniref:DUF1636 family protein n=1 Tax=Granulosicoccus sp. 3-233 TaxID=3417969 RepID=UPI003D332DE7
MITVVVCTTCGQQEDSVDGLRPGEHFANRVEEALKQHALADVGAPVVQLQRTRCLMSCKRSCSAALHQSGKYSYVFGEFSPDVDSAEALLDFTAGYRVSETGQVPFKQWPQGIKGHFVARIPPLQFSEVADRRESSDTNDNTEVSHG